MDYGEINSLIAKCIKERNNPKTTGTEFNKHFDDAINQIKDAKSHWMINPSMSLIELRIAKSKLEKIIKLIKE